MVLLSTPPAPYGNRKTTQEKKRRDEINAKIKDLQILIQQDSEQEKMTQSDVLNRTVQLVTRMESENPGPSTNPNLKGFFDGFSAVEHLTYSFIKGLGMNSDVSQDFIQRATQFFNRERSSLLVSPSGKKKNDILLLEPRSSPSQSCSPSTSDSGLSIDRKEVKKNREQDRRDRQGEAFEALKNFIITHKLTSPHQVEKMQRLNTLDIIISYIRNKKNNFVCKNGQDQALYAHAVAEGRKTAKNVAFQFFKSDLHLVVRCGDLENFLSPKPLIGFPPVAVPPFCPPIFNPFRQFPLFNVMVPNPPSQQQSPSYSVDSPPPSSDTSTSSIETTPNENTKKSKVFRPWE